MLKSTILEQKIQKEALLKERYIPRYQTGRLKKMLDNKLIKVIVGPRRAGKSFLWLI